ncbi:MAG: GNAT family N-acetyltransferase [Actinobacteria bacterium]|nr:GNAT family N-acetyltransferase [Actinomycetota bacterium]
MEIVRREDAPSFLSLAGPLLSRDEARNQLALAVAGTVVEHPHAYERSRFWVAVERGEPTAAALRTSPHDLILADPLALAALRAVVDAVAADDPDVPGVVGNMPHVEEAAVGLAAATGGRPEQILSQGVFALRQIREVAAVPGQPRKATDGDRALLRAWMVEFLVEAVPDPQHQLDQLDRSLDTRFSSVDGGFWFWEDTAPVSLAGFGGRTPTGIRVGPVYTPPEFRRRGYATALVAELSRWLQQRGHSSVFLFTDLSNPTSNRIYLDIGYEQVADSAVFRFRRD